jgi:hypothetical protein
LVTLYPDVQAQLFGLGFVSPRTAVWATLKSKFAPDDDLDDAAAGTERWAVAAYRMSAAANSTWRAKLVKVADGFNNDTYIYRPGIAAATLYEGGTFLPSLLTPASK